MRPEIIMIAAVADNGVIGNNNSIPWYVKEDFKHFKEQTYGYPMIMGRSTFESLPKVLPGRKHIVLSSKTIREHINNVVFCSNKQQALDEIKDCDKVFICGGASIYELFEDVSTKIILSNIHCSPEGDTYFPILKYKWSVSKTTHIETEKLINMSITELYKNNE